MSRHRIVTSSERALGLRAAARRSARPAASFEAGAADTADSPSRREPLEAAAQVPQPRPAVVELEAQAARCLLGPRNQPRIVKLRQVDEPPVVAEIGVP